MLLHQSCKLHLIRYPSSIPCCRASMMLAIIERRFRKSACKWCWCLCQIANVGILSLKSTTRCRIVRLDQRIGVTQSRAHSERRHRKTWENGYQGCMKIRHWAALVLELGRRELRYSGVSTDTWIAEVQDSAEILIFWNSSARESFLHSVNTKWSREGKPCPLKIFMWILDQS